MFRSNQRVRWHDNPQEEMHRWKKASWNISPSSGQHTWYQDSTFSTSLRGQTGRSCNTNCHYTPWVSISVGCAIKTVGIVTQTLNIIVLGASQINTQIWKHFQFFVQIESHPVYHPSKHRKVLYRNQWVDPRSQTSQVSNALISQVSMLCWHT